MRTNRKAFTLIELLVVLFILSVTTGFVLFASMSARNRSRKLSCQNNLSQIGKALSNFENVNSRYPGVYNGVVNGTKRSSTVNNTSPMLLIEPYLTGTQIGAAINDSQIEVREAPPGLICPDDGKATSFSSNYRFCRGIFPIWPQDPRGVFFKRTKGVTAAEITDGLSNTAFCSERLVSLSGGSDNFRDFAECSEDVEITNWCVEKNASHSLVTYSLDESGSRWNSGEFFDICYYHAFTPNSLWYDCRHNDGLDLAVVTARSNHAGGVYVGRGDGSVSFVTATIDPKLWQSLATRDGGEVSSQD